MECDFFPLVCGTLSMLKRCTYACAFFGPSLVFFRDYSQNELLLRFFSNLTIEGASSRVRQRLVSKTGWGSYTAKQSDGSTGRRPLEQNATNKSVALEEALAVLRAADGRMNRRR